MKKTLLLIVLMIGITACKDKETKVVENSVPEIEQKNKPIQKKFKGEFIYVAEQKAAVLKGNSFIHGINLNGKAYELIQEVEKVKKDKYDMIPVVVTGNVSSNNGLKEGEEGWKTVLTIDQIIEVSDSPAAADVKTEDNNS